MAWLKKNEATCGYVHSATIRYPKKKMPYIPHLKSRGNCSPKIDEWWAIMCVFSPDTQTIIAVHFCLGAFFGEMPWPLPHFPETAKIHLPKTQSFLECYCTFGSLKCAHFNTGSFAFSQGNHKIDEFRIRLTGCPLDVFGFLKIRTKGISPIWHSH